MKKCIKYIVRPIAVIMIFGMFAAARGIQIVFAAKEETTTTLPEVVVTGKNDKRNYKPTKVSSSKYSEDLINIPQTIQVIPEGVMIDQQATTLREALRNVPGISLQAGEGGVPAGDNLSIRGFNARTDMFVDGVRDFGGYTRDSFNLQQLEVTKGPTSSYAGRGSAGGSLNQVSKTPQMDDAFYRGSVGFGSEYYKRTTVDLNQPLKSFPIEGTAVRLNGMFHDADVANRDEVNVKRWGVAPSVSFGLETDLRVNLSYFYMGQDNLPDYGLPWVPPANAVRELAGRADHPAPVSWQNFYGLTERDYEKTATHMFTGKVEYDVNESLSLRNQLRYGSASRDSIITAPRFASSTGANTFINRQVQSRDQIDTILNNQTDTTLKFDTGPIGHTLISGLEYSHETSDNRPRTGAATPVADFFNPEPGQSYITPIILASTKNEATSDSVGLYTFDTIALHRMLDLVGGLRWDYFDTRFQASGSNNVLHRIDKMFSWRGGVVFKPVPIGSIYFGYGTSYNPSAEGLSLSTSATNAANILLNPEKTRSYEIGTKWDVFQERLQLTAALFRMDKVNARVTDPGTSASTADDTLVLQGKQKVHGMEFGLAGNITQEWRAFAGYTVMDSEVVKTRNFGELGKELPNTPNQSLSVWTTYQLPWNFEIGGGVQYVGERFNSTLNNREAPRYWLFDLMAAYKLSEQITLRINASNLTDQEYISGLGGGHFIPGAGRSVVASTEFEF